MCTRQLGTLAAFTPLKLLNDKSLLIEYIKNPEVAISCIKDIYQKVEALQWLIDNYGDTFLSFSLEGQADLYKMICDSGCTSILNQLTNIEYLNISSCNLATITDTSHLHNVKVLNLSKNSIRELPQYFSHYLYNLQEFDISGNQIVQVDLGDSNFERLSLLTCGSSEPWNIVYATLRRIICGKLEVHVPSEYRTTLLFPKYVILSSGPKAIKAFLENEELDLSEIKSPNDDLSYYRALLANAQKPITSIRLSTIHFLPDLLRNTSFRSLHNKVVESTKYLYIDDCNIPEFPTELFSSGITEIDISHNKLMEDFKKLLPPVRELKVKNCQLFKLPKLENLRLLDIQDNHISTLETNFVYTNLESLNIQGNPIGSVDFSRDSFPKLKTIHLGSSVTNYVSRRVLESQIQIFFESKYLHHLILPPVEYLSSPSALNRYVRTEGKEKFLTLVKNKNKVQALRWLIEDSRAAAFETFDLSGQADLFSLLQQQGLETLISSTIIQSVVVLFLDDCGLSKTPNIESLTRLSRLSISNNNIEHIHDITNTTVKHLLVQGNPIENIHFTPSNLPSLIQLTCGSKSTREISPSVLERVFKGLKIEIPPEFQPCLQVPPFEIINQGMTAIMAYFNARKLNLSSKYFETMFVNFMTDLIQHQQQNIKVLKVSGQRRTFRTRYHVTKILSLTNLNCLEELYMDDCGLTEIPKVRHLSSLKCVDISSNAVSHLDLRLSLNLPNLHTLRLNECGLERFVDISCLPLLKHLELRRNNLKDLKCFDLHASDTKLHPLEKLDIRDNPIEEINVDKESYPMLSYLTCGSPNTYYISFSLMMAMSKSNVTVEVSKPYKNFLLIPSAAELDDAKCALAAFLKEKIINIKRISDVQQRHNAFLSLLKKKHVQFSTLVLSDQSDFCHYKRVDLRYFFNHSSFAGIKTLYLDNCNLTNIPNIYDGLRQLELLDVSNNKLTRIFDGSGLQYPNLSKLFLQENPIQTIEIENCGNKCPCLKYIRAGSEYTFKIGNTLLGRVASDDLKVDIVENYGKFLVQPPYEVLILGSKTVKVYLNDGHMEPKIQEMVHTFGKIQQTMFWCFLVQLRVAKQVFFKQ